VPGNPGIPHYYCDFGEELQKAFENEDLDSPTRLDEDLKARCFFPYCKSVRVLWRCCLDLPLFLVVNTELFKPMFEVPTTGTHF